MKRTALFGLCAAGVAALAACGVKLIESSETDLFVLVDASGTYAANMDSAVQASRLMAVQLAPKDTITFAQISSCSFSDENVVLRSTLPSTPSRAAMRKQDIFRQLDQYRDTFQATSYTDIRGALKYASFELAQSGKDAKYIVVFSDMVEDTAPDCDTRDLAIDLTGITVIATNVTKLRSDSANPEAYFDRLAKWEEIVTSAGGIWVLAPNTEQVLESIS